MGQHFSLVAADSFKLGAYRAEPSGTPKGGIVVIQEIFGVNHHIRAVCDRLAAQGYAEYLRRFPAAKNRYELTYYLADCQYYSLQFGAAADTFAAEIAFFASVTTER